MGEVRVQGSAHSNNGRMPCSFIICLFYRCPCSLKLNYILLSSLLRNGEAQCRMGSRSNNHPNHPIHLHTRGDLIPLFTPLSKHQLQLKPTSTNSTSPIQAPSQTPLLLTSNISLRKPSAAASASNTRATPCFQFSSSPMISGPASSCAVFLCFLLRLLPPVSVVLNHHSISGCFTRSN